MGTLGPVYRTGGADTLTNIHHWFAIRPGGAIGTPVSRVCFHGSASRGSIYLFWFCNVHLSGPPLLTPVKMMRSALSLTRPEMLNSKQRLQHALGVCGGGRPSLSPNKLKHSY